MPPTNHSSTTASPAASSPELPPPGGLCAIHHGRQTAIQNALIVETVRSRRRTAQMLQQHYGDSLHWPAFHQALTSVLDLFDTTDKTADVAEASTRLDPSLWPKLCGPSPPASQSPGLRREGP